MKAVFIALSMMLFSNCIAQTNSEIQLVRTRVLEILKMSQTISIQEYVDKNMDNEYYHPEYNDSGISYLYPDFVPHLEQNKGFYIINSINDIEIDHMYKGKSDKIISNGQNVYFVEVVYKTIAGFSLNNRAAGIIINNNPIIYKQYIIMAQDLRDSKWKYLGNIPTEMSFYIKDKFFEDSREIQQVYAISNMDFILTKLKE